MYEPRRLSQNLRTKRSIVAATTPKERRRGGRRCYARPIPSLLRPLPTDMRGRDHLYPGPVPRPPPRSKGFPRTRATRVAPTVQSWHSTVMLSYSRTEGFGGSDGRRLRGRVGRALEGFRGQRRLPGPFGSDRPLARVQEGHSRNIERWFSDQLHQGFRTSGGVALLVRWGKAE